MADQLRFDGKVVIVTGAGNGLGRAHALLFGSRGAKVVVNDLGSSIHGGGKSSAAADKVVEEIKALGGDAVANYDSVEDGAKIVQTALDTWKRIDVIVNNAGILRDTTFHKMSQDDWDLIYRVHVLGGFRVTHAAWEHMRTQNYGRVIFTASAAGIYGNFGQANYSTAKLGIVGLSNTLAIEGKKKGIHVNTIAPIAGSRLTETVLPKDLIDALKPEFVSPLVAWLAHESCDETGGLYEVGGGFVSKLRWERTLGKSFKLSRAMTPEGLRDSWREIVDFGKASYPTDITASMEPVLANLGTAKSKGGANEFIDVDEALGYAFEPYESKYDEKELALYALGVGAAQNPLDATDLRYVYEMHGDGFQAVPTYAVVPALSAIIELTKQGKAAPGLNYGFDRVLHGEQYTELKRPLPTHAKLVHKAKIKDIFDKGKNALVITAITTTDETGEELAYNEVTTFVRGAGGFGGERGPSADVNVPPERAPDAVVEEKTSANQALLYRLTGDINPLHADPGFAKAFGFDKPILHGLCTFGFAGRHVVQKFAPNGDPRFFKSIKVRFADSVFPGETLVTEMWKEADGRIVLRTKVKERDKVVISNAAVELWKELPKPAAKPVAAAATAATPAAPSAPSGPKSAIVFNAIKEQLAAHPEMVAKVQTVFAFKLSNPDSAWTIDVKNGAGSVASGIQGTPDVTFELAESDYLELATGKADPQKLYFGGKLKISGNLMAAQKLAKIIDPASAKEMAAKLAANIAAPAPAPAAAAAPAAPSGPKSAIVFNAIKEQLAAHPEMVAKVQTVFLFKLSNPDSTWTIDVKNGGGSVTSGVQGTPDVTFELAESDYLELATGKANPMKLYTGGKLKISGNLMAAQKLATIIDPASAKEMAAKLASSIAAPPAAAAAAPAPAPAAPAKDGKAAKLFVALGERIAKNAGLVGEVGAIVQFNVKSPDGAWVVDLKNGPGSVKQGSSKEATCTITAADDDLAALAAGDSPQALYQKGKLRIDGDIRVAHRLGFMKQLA